MIDILVNEFAELATKHYQYTQEGDWRKTNEQVKNINKIFSKIKESGDDAIEGLLSLTCSSKPEVASMAAVYSMRYNPEKCLEVLHKLSERNIPHISFGAKWAIKTWENNEWDID